MVSSKLLFVNNHQHLLCWSISWWVLDSVLPTIVMVNVDAGFLGQFAADKHSLASLVFPHPSGHVSGSVPLFRDLQLPSAYCGLLTINCFAERLMYQFLQRLHGFKAANWWFQSYKAILNNVNRPWPAINLLIVSNQRIKQLIHHKLAHVFTSWLADKSWAYSLLSHD